MGFSYEVDPEGLAGFVERARTLSDELGQASPDGNDSLSGLEGQAAALSDPDIAGLLSGIFSQHGSDLTNAVAAANGAIDSVERAGAVVTDTDGTSRDAFNTLNTGPYSSLRFSVQ